MVVAAVSVASAHQNRAIGCVEMVAKPAAGIAVPAEMMPPQLRAVTERLKLAVTHDERIGRPEHHVQALQARRE